MQLFAGLDLNLGNTSIHIMDTEFKRVFGKWVVNKQPMILKTLKPFQDQLNWIIEGLIDAGYHCVHLANPSENKQYK